jgi:hypothetical protein
MRLGYNSIIYRSGRKFSALFHQFKSILLLDYTCTLAEFELAAQDM